MTCAEVERMQHAYLDGELDAPTAAAIEAHVADCAACAARLAALSSLSAALRTAPYYRAPASLEAWALPSRATPRYRAAWLPWLTAAAALLLATASVLFALTRRVPTHDDLASDMVVSSHLRSLMAEHLVDIASPDRQTIRPWLAGRLAFAPAVADLASDGFALAGGRLDQIGAHQAAAVVYRKGEHVINVFEWASTASDAPLKQRTDARGYQLRYWTSRGVSYWIVSDVAPAEIDDFAARLERAIASPS